MKNMFLVLMVSAMALTSCGSADKKSNAKSDQMELSGGYEVITLAKATISDNTVTLNFVEGEGKVNGDAACNQFYGNYESSGNTVKFSKIGQTKMMCTPEVMEVESTFFLHLSNTSSYKTKEGNLVLMDKSGTELMTLKKK